MSLNPTVCKEPKFVQLQTCEGYIHDVETSLLEQMGTVHDLLMVECSDSNGIIPLLKIESRIMKLVVQWCRLVQNNSARTEASDRSTMFTELLEEASGDDKVVIQLLLAANYLHVESLLEVGTQYLADVITACETAEEIRIRFNLQNDIPSDETEEP
ncbi:uncharacterized protein Dana_GF26426 [Drosophila ananassae]|uniref:SKP1 component POZ domain-containing protein n=1 Tax=Drosophila ananassae TaxID=7217 RepID=A0A0P8ZY23_DROAN|nr:SKP1-like protein 11 [Drosophila ananassae]KPU79578.1 uncharacterized protein Dana_GF26426 [Drosophila ananassae]